MLLITIIMINRNQKILGVSPLEEKAIFKMLKSHNKRKKVLELRYRAAQPNQSFNIVISRKFERSEKDYQDNLKS